MSNWGSRRLMRLIRSIHALTATFTSLADENSQGRSSYYVCVYDLTNLQTRDVLWTGSYEVQKKAVKGFLD